MKLIRSSTLLFCWLGSLL